MIQSFSWSSNGHSGEFLFTFMIWHKTHLLFNVICSYINPENKSFNYRVEFQYSQEKKKIKVENEPKKLECEINKGYILLQIIYKVTMSENSYANTYKNILILVCYLSLFNYGRRYIRITYCL